MDSGFIERFKISRVGDDSIYPYPLLLKDALNKSLFYIENPASEKLCLIFPTKELAAQWFAIPLALKYVQKDYYKYAHEIYNAHKMYREGDKLILNNNSVVEWVGSDKEGITFKTKKKGRSENPQITVKFEYIIKLQPAPSNRNALSTYKRVRQGLFENAKHPIDKLLRINSEGNRLFLKNSIGLISNINVFSKVNDEINVNRCPLGDFLLVNKVNKKGEPSAEFSPLLLTNDLINLTLYLQNNNSVGSILIDGYSHIYSRKTDFLDIAQKNIPVILFTDLSEIEHFQSIKDLGFNFLNINNEDHIKQDMISNSITSPFKKFQYKLSNYLDFKLEIVKCQYDAIESACKLIQSVAVDNPENELIKIKIQLIHIFNLISRISYLPNEEISNFILEKIICVEELFKKHKLWIGDQSKSIETSIIQLKEIFASFSNSPSPKCNSLLNLINENDFDFIICPTEREVKVQKEYLSGVVESAKKIPNVISVSDVNDTILSKNNIRVILTGWPRSDNLNKLLTNFHFRELKAIYYQFENVYHDSLQSKNINRAKITSSNIFSTPSSEDKSGYLNFFKSSNSSKNSAEAELDFDIVDFEMKIDESYYSGYIVNSDDIDSLKAKRIEFDNERFIYSSESHSLIKINNLLETHVDPNIEKIRVNQAAAGDIIVFISTDRDILVETVKKQVNASELEIISHWTSLWKTCLREYYWSLGKTFQQLSKQLRASGCNKTDAAIRTWLFDINMIGPNDDKDLIAIGKVTQNKELINNIDKVRKSILQMRRWRIQASNHINTQIKLSLSDLIDESLINKEYEINGLGKINVLKIRNIASVWENVDLQYVNKLIQNEI
jgi:hypothetical protein